MAIFRLASLLCVLAIGSVAQVASGQVATEQDAPTQDPGEDPKRARDERALRKTRTILEERPTHAALFDRYFKLLVETNSIDTEIQSLREQLEAEPTDGCAIVLGRMLLRTGKEDQALEVLDSVPAKSASVQGVLGDIYFKLARFDAAARSFEAALPSATTSRQKRMVYEKLGKAQLALNQKSAAIATWSKISELDGGKFNQRLGVAELLTEAGLLDEASAAYAPLIDETKGDPARHCQVLRDVGRLHELQGELDTALSTYESVLAITARGNWLRKEVEKRVVQIYRRTGRLDELVARLRTQVEESADDLASYELLADVLLETRDLDGAAATLTEIAPRFPKDIRLARRLAQLHVERKDIDAAIAEYQRIIGERPAELELYLELGVLFARGERFSEAKNQWEKALAQNLKDPSLCTRLAAMYALWDREEDAVRLYRRAVELEPDSIVRRVDLAEFQFGRKEREAGESVLREAFEVAGDKPRRLEMLVGPFREHAMIEMAQSCLERVLAVEPKNHEIRFALAELLLREGDIDAARPLLWQIIDEDELGTGQRTLAANTLVQLAARQQTLDELLQEAGSRDSAGASFVAGRAHSRARDFPLAIDAYRAALVKSPSDVQSRRLLARLLAEEGDYEGSLAEYAQLGVITPGERRRNFREVAQLHLELYDLDEAVETWQRAMRDNPDNAAVFIQVGKEFLSINRIPQALRAFEQAALLRPNDADVLIRYADALRQFGKSAEAEEKLTQVAIQALDSRDRDHARKKLFELFAEQGALDRKIASMQNAVEENPYDADTPQLLADLYNRTGDYLLGLEMIEYAVKFQPRNRELLTRRAELLEALEEWEKARDVHEELLKFPDADRDAHLASIGRALYEIGDAEAAKATFRKIRDRGRIRKLYTKYRLHDEAVDYFKRAIARNPSDFRSFYYLAAEHEKRSERKEAIDALERALNMRPYYRQALELVGKLYVQDGRREDAVKVGMRLFGLRGESVEKSKHEEREETGGRSRYRSRRRNRNFSQRRLASAKSYFESRGLRDEWGGILLAECRRRPADERLFTEVRNHYKWREKSASKFMVFIDELLAADWSRTRIPPGFTRRSYREKLERERLTLFKEDASLAEQRLEELADDEGRTVSELVERAKVHHAVGQLDAMEADLLAALSGTETDPVACALLVENLVEQKRYGDAVPIVDRLIAWWDGAGESETVAAEVALRREVTFKRGRKSMLDALPRRIRRRVDNDMLRSVGNRTRTSAWHDMTSLNFPESVPTRFACFVKLVGLQRAAGQQDMMGETLARAMAAAGTIGQRSHLGGVLFREGFKTEARGLLESVLASAEKIKSDPIEVYFWTSFRNTVGSAAESLGDVMAEHGETLAAYRLLRDYGHAAKAELLLRQSGQAEALVADLVANVATTQAKLGEARRGDASGEDLRAVELEYRDAVIKLADYSTGEKEFGRSEQLYQDSLEFLPNDIEIREVLAALRLRRGDHAAAVATHEEIIDVKRRRRRAAAGDTGAPPTRLQPRMPGDSNRSGGGFRVSGPFGGVRYFGGRFGYSGGSGRFDVKRNYESILEIYQDRNDNEGILGMLRKVIRDDPTSFRDLAWEVQSTLRNEDLGKQKLPILRILKSVVKDEDWLTLAYGRACSEEEDLQEAKRTFEKLLAKNITGGGNSWYLEETEEELKKVLQKLGEAEPGVAELRTKVEAEPENVRHRMRLARKLLDEHEYDAALIEVRVIVEKAPYMMKAKEMVVEAATAASENGEALAMLRRLFEESTDSNDKLRRGVTFANWLHADGQADEAFAVVGGLEMQSGGSRNFSAGNWFLDKNQMERALEHFEVELEKSKTRQWDEERLRKRIARLEAAAGEIDAAVTRYLDALNKAGSLSDREERFKDLLRMCKGYPDPDSLCSHLEADHGKRETVEDLLVLAAAEFAKGDAIGAERDLARAVEMSPKETYLFPVLVGLRRLHDDWDGALEVLDQMERVYGGSDSMQWRDGVTLSERDRLKLVRADLLERAGRPEQATALIEGVLDETDPGTLQKLSSIYKQRGDKPRALEWHRRYMKRLGTRKPDHVRTEADYLFELGRLEECLEVAQEAYLSDPSEGSSRTLMIKVHRELDRLPELVVELEQRFAKDFRDGGLRSSLLALYKELERFDDRRAIFDRMLEEEDLRESGLSSLVALSNEEGDTEAAISFMRQQLDLKGGRQKKRVQRSIADKLVELDKLEEAEAIYREALELDTAEGQLSLGRWLRRNDRLDAAVVAFERVLVLDPENKEVLEPYLGAAWKSQDWQAVLVRAMEHIDRQHGKTTLFSGNTRTFVLDALHGLDDDSRVAVLDGKGPGEHAAELAVVANLALANWSDAEAGAESLLESEPGSLIALDARRLALRQQDKLEELVDATEALRIALEKEYVVNDEWRYSQRARTLQNQLGEISLERGDDEAAEREWRESPIRRTPYSNPFGYYRSDWQVRYTANLWLDARRPERALEALEREFLLRETAPWSTRTRALEEVGRADEVEAFAWKRLLDPMELYGIQSGSYGWIWSDGEYRQSQGMQDFLVDFYRRRDGLDDLRARATELLESPQTRRQARDLLDALAVELDDKLERANAEEGRLRRKKNGDEKIKESAFRLAKLWHAAGRHERAIELMAEELELDSPAAKQRKRRTERPRFSRRSSEGDDEGSPFSFSFDNSSSYYYSWRSRTDLDELRAFLAAVWFSTGDRERAMAIEEDLLDAPAPPKRLTDTKELAGHYTEFHVPLEAARLYRAVLVDEAFDLDDDDRVGILRALVRAYRDAEDDAGRLEAAREHRSVLARQLAEAPGPHAFSIRSSLGSLLLDELSEAEAALEQYDFLLRFRPQSTRYLGRRARALDMLGRHIDAVEALRKLSQLRRDRCDEDTATEQAWLGLALAHAGETEAGKTMLIKVASRLAKDSPLAEEVRVELGKL